MFYSIVTACQGAAPQETAHSNSSLPPFSSVRLDMGLQNTPLLHTMPRDKYDQHFTK